MIRLREPFVYLATSCLTMMLYGQTQANESPDYIDIARKSLAEVDDIDMRKSWFYTVTANTDGEVLVSQNDPRKLEGETRELLTVNGEPPTEERLKAFKKQEAARNDTEDDENSQDSFSEMIDFSTLALKEVSDGQVILSYTPVLDRMEEESDKLEGTLKLNEVTHFVEEISLVNTEKISPAFSVSLTTFNMRFLFSPVEGETLLSRMETNIKGKAGFLKKFKSETDVVFSDFKRMSEPWVPAGSIDVATDG